MIENKSSKHALQSGDVEITAYDSENKVLATDTVYLYSLYPGEKQAHHFFFDCKGETPSKIEYNVDSVRMVSPDTKKAISSDFSFSGTNERIDEKYGDSSITGTVKNNSSYDVDNAEIIVTYKKEGKIVGGYWAYVDNLSAGKEKPFEINAYNIPEHDSYELSVNNQTY